MEFFSGNSSVPMFNIATGGVGLAGQRVEGQIQQVIDQGLCGAGAGEHNPLPPPQPQWNFFGDAKGAKQGFSP